MSSAWIEYIVKLILFSITYYFVLDYVFVCNVPTKYSATIVASTLVIITILYILFAKKDIRRCDTCGENYKMVNKHLRVFN